MTRNSTLRALICAIPLTMLPLLRAQAPAVQGALPSGVATQGRLGKAPTEIPAPLPNFLMAARQRPIQDLEVGGLAMRAIDKPLGTPFLLWPKRAKDERSPAADPVSVRAWLAASGNALQHAGFVPEFVREGTIYDTRFLRFRLVASGLPLWDHQIDVFFQDGVFVGLTNETPSDIASRETQEDAPVAGQEQTWFADRASGRTALVIARVLRTETADHRITEVKRGERLLARVSEQKTMPPVPAAAAFTEWTVPGGVFVDQIGVDAIGKVWFSDPSANTIISFDPKLQTFQTLANPTGSGPDGLCVDDRGRVWWGNYYSGSMGRYDSVSKTFKSFPANYSPSAPAVPCTTQAGTLWITDHANNRISHFNLLTETWIASYVMPTAACWVVGGAEDPNRSETWFTEFYGNKMARVTAAGAITEIAAPAGGPAFATVCQDRVYWSEWNRARIGSYDPRTQVVTGYTFPLSAELGGPITSTSNGLVATGTRGTGYIMIFDVKTSLFTSFKVPSASPGFKDGITVGPDNTIWFTETGIGKIGRLVLP